MIRCKHNKLSGKRLRLCKQMKCKGIKEHSIMQKCDQYRPIREPIRKSVKEKG